LHGPWSLGPLGKPPGFGFGFVLLVWLVGGFIWFGLRWRASRSWTEWIGPIILWLAGAVVIVLIPDWSLRGVRNQIARISVRIQRGQASSADWIARGALFAESLDFRQALQDYRQATTLAPDDPEPHARLAWLLATCPADDIRNAREALQEAKEACRLTSYRQPHCLEVLAAAHAEARQWEQAVRWQREAARRAAASSVDSERLRLAELRQTLSQYVRHRPHRSRYGHSVPVFGYGFMLFLGFLGAGWLATVRARCEGIDSQIVWDLAMWIFLAGILGARVFYVVQKHDQVFSDAKTLSEYAIAAINVREGGLVFYGSVLGGMAGFWVFCRRRKLRPLQISDMVVPSIFVGLALGRIGCFLNGCCFGDVCHLPWSVEFPLGSVPDMALVLRGWVLPDAVHSLPLHPTQLYSSVNAMVLAVLAWAWFSRRRFHGEISALALITYAVTRFTLEILRGDELGQFGTRLTISQWISMGLLAAGLALAVWCRRIRSHELVDQKGGVTAEN